MELDDRYSLIRRGARVLDLGAAPGGWSQVAAKRGAGAIVGVDLLADRAGAGRALHRRATSTTPTCRTGCAPCWAAPADLVLSDMAPNTTGHTATDHVRIVALAELALDFALAVLAPGGGFVAKVLQGGSEKQLLEPMKRAFASVRHAKPPASRKDSSEMYVVAKGFRGAGRHATVACAVRAARPMSDRQGAGCRSRRRTAMAPDISPLATEAAQASRWADGRSARR